MLSWHRPIHNSISYIAENMNVGTYIQMLLKQQSTCVFRVNNNMREGVSAYVTLANIWCINNNSHVFIGCLLCSVYWTNIDTIQDMNDFSFTFLYIVYYKASCRFFLMGCAIYISPCYCRLSVIMDFLAFCLVRNNECMLYFHIAKVITNTLLLYISK